MNGKKIFAAVAVLLVLTACIAAAGCVSEPEASPDERALILGDWTADIQSVLATLQSFGLDASQFGIDLNLITMFVPDVILSFSDDGTGTLSIAGFKVDDIAWEYQGDYQFQITMFDHDVTAVMSQDGTTLSDEHNLLSFKKK